MSTHAIPSIRRFLRLLLVLVAALGALPPAAHAQSGPRDGQPVKELVFVGNTTVSDAFLERQLKLVPGETYSADALNRDYKRMAQLGFFLNVEVATEQVTGGVKITYTVTENLIVGEITAVGFESLTFRGDVKAQMRLKVGRPYSAYLARLDKQRLEQLYSNEGYPFANVRVLTREKPPKIEVRYRVDEGPKVDLWNIRFEGNAAFSDRELKKQMQLEESGWLPFFREEFDPDLLREDLIALLRFYRQKGFLDAEVALSDINYNDDKTRLSIDIAISEGPRYRIDKVDFVGNKLFTTTELRNRLQMEPGSPYDEELLLQGKSKIEQLYGDNARITARVSIGQIFPDQGSKVSLVVQIAEGERIFVEGVDIRGNEVTKDRVIRREILLLPGDPFNISKVRKSNRKLLSLNYFDSVNFDIQKPQSGDEAARDLIAEVVEKSTGDITFAVGVTSNAGLVGELSLRERNFDISRLPTSWSDFIGGNAFKGAGQFFQIQLQPGTEFNRFALTFREPSVAGSPYSFGVELFGTLRERETYDEQRFGVRLSTSRRFYRDEMRVGVILNLERVNIENVAADAPLAVEEVEGDNLLGSVTLTWSWDKRNDPILPSAGYRLGASLELAGGDFTYVKQSLRGSYYYTTHFTKDRRPYILTTSARLGIGGGDIPIFSRYYAGGFGSVRGFDFRSASPRQDGEIVGGEGLALLNFEYSIPLVEEYLRMVTFLDLGAAGEDVGDALSEMRAGLGAGIRVRLPFLGPVPLAIDFAVPLREREGDETQVVSFSLGRSF